MIFIFQYYNLRKENQEACYNVARAFHQIGKQQRKRVKGQPY